MSKAELTLEEVLAFERRWYIYAGNKTTAMEQRFGVTVEEYEARLSEILEDPAALAFDRILVTRIKRLRMHRSRIKRGERVDSSIGYKADTDGFPSSRD